MIDYIQIKCGPMDNFTYVIYNTLSRNGIIIDPGWDPEKIIEIVETNTIKPTFILLTHGHHDHHNAADNLCKKFEIPILISALEDPKMLKAISSPTLFDPERPLSFDENTIQVIATPGHSPGGTCFIIDRLLITGDTLFINGCGRCDLGHSDIDAMYESLEKIKGLPGHLLVLPGHHYGEKAVAYLKDEIKTNRFLTCKDKHTFIRKRK